MGDKFIGIDGYAVRTYLECRGEGESDVLHVVNDMEYALDLATGDDSSVAVVYDRDNLCFEATILAESKGVLEALLKGTKFEDISYGKEDC